MSEILNEITKKYERLEKSYQYEYDKNKELNKLLVDVTKERDIAQAMTPNVLTEKYDKLKRDYDSLTHERNNINSKYSSIQRIHETCKLQQQEAESRNNLLQAQLVSEERHSNITTVQLKQKTDIIEGFVKSGQVLIAKNQALKIEYDIMKDKFEERVSYGKSMDTKLIAYREDNARLERDIKNKDKDYKNLKTVYDQLGKNNDDLRNRLKQLVDLKPTLKSFILPAFALFVVGILPHLLSYRLR